MHAAGGGAGGWGASGGKSGSALPRLEAWWGRAGRSSGKTQRPPQITVCPKPQTPQTLQPSRNPPSPNPPQVPQYLPTPPHPPREFLSLQPPLPKHAPTHLYPHPPTPPPQPPHPQEILSLQPSFIELLGLKQSLTPSRNNGFLNMLLKMQRATLALAAAQAQ